MAFHIRLGVLGLALVSWYCVQSQQSGNELPPILQKSSDVTPDDPIAQHTVALADPDPRIGSFCTAVVLTPHILLSSARCFLEKDLIPFALFERSKPDAATEERFQSIPIRRVALHVEFQKERFEQEESHRAHPKYLEHPSSPATPMYDLALAWLEEAIPEHYRPVALAGTHADLQQSQLVQAGYGCREQVCDEDELRLHKTPVQSQVLFPQVAFALLRSHLDRGTCRGDMGGPYFQVSTESVRLFALSSTNASLCERGILGESLVAPFQVWLDQARLQLEQRDTKKSNLVQIIDFEGSDNSGRLAPSPTKKP